MHGLKILASKELLSVVLSSSGINYRANESTSKFLSYFKSNYYRELDNRVSWTVERFKDYNNETLHTFIDENLHKWGSDLIEDSQTI